MNKATDAERLRQWMTDNEYTMKSLSRKMDIRYNTFWRMLEREAVADKFITRFIGVFGCDEAVIIFQDHLAPPTRTTQDD